MWQCDTDQCEGGLWCQVTECYIRLGITMWQLSLHIVLIIIPTSATPITNTNIFRSVRPINPGFLIHKLEMLVTDSLTSSGYFLNGRLSPPHLSGLHPETVCLLLKFSTTRLLYILYYNVSYISWLITSLSLSLKYRPNFQTELFNQINVQLQGLIYRNWFPKHIIKIRNIPKHNIYIYY